MAARLATPCMFALGCSFTIGQAPNEDAGEPSDADGPVASDAPDAPVTSPSCIGTSLVLCLPFDDALIDGSPSGTLVTGSSLTYEPGVAGKAARLSATSLIDVAENAFTDPLEITLEAWVKPDAGGGGFLLDNENQYSLQIVGTAANCLVVGQTSAFPSSSGGSVPTGVWSHVACTYSAGGLRLYVNGIQVGTDPGDGNLRDLGGTGISIGRNSPVGTNYRGLIDDLRIWSVARAPSDICPSC